MKHLCETVTPAEWDATAEAIYMDGVWAELEGLQPRQCPYASGEERERWLDGWHDTHALPHSRIGFGDVLAYMAAAVLLGAMLMGRF